MPRATVTLSEARSQLIFNSDFMQSFDLSAQVNRKTINSIGKVFQLTENLFIQWWELLTFLLLFQTL